MRQGGIAAWRSIVAGKSAIALAGKKSPMSSSIGHSLAGWIDGSSSRAKIT
ncbi:MAG: hypothetical protein HC778_07845 [Chamaesiphon sp. CSU_1_12]|nr:hypothetical protein [Chamaesiphon sp. CSU_1_12]